MENKDVNWTKVWAKKYNILDTYQNEVDTDKYSNEINRLLESIEKEYRYNKEDSMLVLKDILYHTYLIMLDKFIKYNVLTFY